MTENFTTGLTIGTTKISMIAAERHDPLHVTGFDNARSRGVKSGEIVSLTDASQSVRRAFTELTDITGLKPESVNEVIVVFNASDVSNEPAGAVLDFEQPQVITQDTLRNLVQKARDSLHGDGRKIPVHIFPEKFRLDGLDVSDPADMSGSHLEADFNAVMIPKTCADNVVTCARQAGLRVKGLVLKPLASSLGSVTDEEKSAGCVSVSIGGGVTGAVVFQDGRIVRVFSIPMGGNSITNDIAYCMNVDVREAEILKKRISEPDEAKAMCSEGVDVDRLAEIITARLEEIFSQLRTELDKLADKISPKSAVLSGGTSMMNRIDFLLSEILGLPVRKADRPAVSMMIGCDNAAFVSEAGLLKMLADENTVRFCCAVRNFSLNKL